MRDFNVGAEHVDVGSEHFHAWARDFFDRAEHFDAKANDFHDRAEHFDAKARDFDVGARHFHARAKDFNAEERHSFGQNQHFRVSSVVFCPGLGYEIFDKTRVVSPVRFSQERRAVIPECSFMESMFFIVCRWCQGI